MTSELKLPPKVEEAKAPIRWRTLAGLVDDDTHERTMRLCKKTGYTRSELVRFAIIKVLEANGF